MKHPEEYNNEKDDNMAKAIESSQLGTRYQAAGRANEVTTATSVHAIQYQPNKRKRGWHPIGGREAPPSEGGYRGTRTKR